MLQDRLQEKYGYFRFKHHYILNVLDSEILYELFSAIGEHRQITFTTRRRRITALPLKVYIGTQTGRQYLLAWSPASERFSFYRIDLIDNVKAGDAAKFPADIKCRTDEFCAHTWGVAGNNDTHLEHIEMTVLVGPREGYIAERLTREKRCGTVEQIDDTHWKFSADVYDTIEMMPWLRTFIGRVTDLQCTDQRVIDRFWKDHDAMLKMYGGDHNAVS